MPTETNEVEIGSLRIEFSGNGEELCLERVFTRYPSGAEFCHSLDVFGEMERREMRAASEAEYKRLQKLRRVRERLNL